MQYPEYMTAEEIRAFELEMNDWIDAENKAFHDSLERDNDEAYEPETDDNWYDEQYELDTDYL